MKLPSFKEIVLLETVLNKTLNVAIWDGDSLKPEVLKGMKDIADNFIKFLKIDKEAVTDIVFTGSNAGYTYHTGSDVDIHILIDFEKICDSCSGMSIDDCFKAKKTLWNDQHKIKIKTYDVELYAGDKDDEIPAGAGVYSIKNDKWNQTPEKTKIDIDNQLVSKKAQALEDTIDHLVDSKSNNITTLNNIKQKIKNMRLIGLQKGGEYGIENLAFKKLRDDGYIEKLIKYIGNIEDETLTVEGL